MRGAAAWAACLVVATVAVVIKVAATTGAAGFGGTPSPEAEALQKAIDDNAPAAQIKDLLAKYQASQKDKQAKLATAQDDLRAVLTTKQEAQATLLGLLQ